MGDDVGGGWFLVVATRAARVIQVENTRSVRVLHVLCFRPPNLVTKVNGDWQCFLKGRCQSMLPLTVFQKIYSTPPILQS